MRPKLAITLGDPSGIGPEVILKALSDRSKSEHYEATIIGSRKVIERTYWGLGLDRVFDLNEISILDITIGEEELMTGKGNAASGTASFHYLKKAVELTLSGNFTGIVTGPIAKYAWKDAGYNYPGQTELLAELCGIEEFAMLFVAQSPITGWMLRNLLATTHLPLRLVSDVLSPILLSIKLKLLVQSLKKDFKIPHPKIAIAALNPHGGEEGMLGNEEVDWIKDWLEMERKKYQNSVTLEGLIPPDTMWVKPGLAWFGRGTPTVADAYFALYHDQGLIGVKLMAFDCAVNMSIGLPFIRTSPDHGTAFDIVGQGIADPSSMKAAIDLMVSITRSD